MSVALAEPPKQRPPSRCGQPRRVSEAAYERWVRQNPGKRSEWVDGRIEVMSNASLDHNELAAWLMALLLCYAQQHDLGSVAFDNQMRTINRRRRLPDVHFLREDRRKSLVTDAARQSLIEGVFDLAVEIVTPDEAGRDYVTKYQEYQSAGVPEYWLIDPQNRFGQGWHLVDGKYQPLPRDDAGERFYSTVLPGFWLRPADVFAEPRPAVASLLAEVAAGT